MTLFRFVALLALINVAALLWPSGEKSAVLGPVPESLTDIDAHAVSLLAETDEYAEASTGLVLATIRPDGQAGDAISGPYYMLNEWDDSVTQVVDDVDEIGEQVAVNTVVGDPAGESGLNDSPAASVRPKKNYRPLLLGLRPDLSGGLRTEQVTLAQNDPPQIDDDPTTPDGPPRVALNAQRLRAVLTSFTPDPVADDTPAPAPAPDVNEIKTDATAVTAVVDKEKLEVPKPEKPEGDGSRTQQPNVVGVETKTIVPAPARVAPKVATAVPARPTECVRLGPFFAKEAFDLVAARLKSDGLSFRGRSVDARKVKAIRVYIGPFADEVALKKASEDLRAAGIRDFYVMPRTDDGTTVSLGLFSAQGTADKLVERLVGYKLEVRSREELRQLSPTFWLETDKQGVTSEQRKSISEIPLGDRHARLRKMSCKGRGKKQG